MLSLTFVFLSVDFCLSTKDKDQSTGHIITLTVTSTEGLTANDAAALGLFKELETL